MNKEQLFNNVYNKYNIKLNNYINKHKYNCLLHTTEDISQECFLRYYLKIESLITKYKYETDFYKVSYQWLKTTSKNIINEYFRLDLKSGLLNASNEEATEFIKINNAIFNNVDDYFNKQKAKINNRNKERYKTDLEYKEKVKQRTKKQNEENKIKYHNDPAYREYRKQINKEQYQKRKLKKQQEKKP